MIYNWRVDEPLRLTIRPAYISREFRILLRLYGVRGGPAVERFRLLDGSVRDISGKYYRHSSGRMEDDGSEDRCLCRGTAKSDDAEFADIYEETW